MNITDIRIRTVANANNLKAIATITIDDAFAVHDIKVIEANGVKFIAMPSRKIGDSQRFVDVAHPINQETRTMLQDLILAEYEKVAAEVEADVEDNEIADAEPLA